jgi:hypothetical protein
MFSFAFGSGSSAGLYFGFLIGFLSSKESQQTKQNIREKI